jgi:hypothetical protein
MVAVDVDELEGPVQRLQDLEDGQEGEEARAQLPTLLGQALFQQRVDFSLRADLQAPINQSINQQQRKEGSAHRASLHPLPFHKAKRLYIKQLASTTDRSTVTY